MSTAEKRSMTAAEYLAAERVATEKSEYCRGEVFAMAGASRRHNRISANVVIALGRQLADQPCEVFSSDMRISIRAAELYTYPDISVACPPVEMQDEHDDTLLNPRLIVEVLSPSTASYDRGDKFAMYRRISSLVDYLLIAQDRRAAEHYHRQEDGRWLRTEYADEPFEIELPSIDCRLSAEEIYAKT